MKTSPYELVFGQPPRQCIFPGANKTQISEEDLIPHLNVLNLKRKCFMQVICFIL